MIPYLKNSYSELCIIIVTGSTSFYKITDFFQGMILSLYPEIVYAIFLFKSTPAMSADEHVFSKK